MSSRLCFPNELRHMHKTGNIIPFFLKYSLPCAQNRKWKYSHVEVTSCCFDQFMTDSRPGKTYLIIFFFLFRCYLNKSQTISEHHSGWYSPKWKLYTCIECTVHCTLVQSLFSGASIWMIHSYCIYFIVVSPCQKYRLFVPIIWLFNCLII